MPPSPASPLSPPLVVIPTGPGGLGLSLLHTHRELDALSYGFEFPLLDQLPPLAFYGWQFSVDEFAVGLPGVPAPSVTTEGASVAGAKEAAADIYGSLTSPGPLAPVAGGNVGIFDGNGAPPFGGPSLNLVEPNPPSAFVLPDQGDNLDAWDFDTPVTPAGDTGTALSPPVYFSLDSAFPDPLEPLPGPNTGTALANGFVGGDVLVTSFVGGPPVLYADSRALGLNGGIPTADPNTIDEDDLDALILWEDGSGVYEPVTGPYSWLGFAGAPTDMLLYSVRRNSSIIGTLDALGTGLLIEESDILVPVMTGPGVWAPGIFIPGDVLGLATVRSGTPLFSPDGASFYADDLDALDVIEVVIPEPTSILLALFGMASACCWRRRR